MRRLKRKWQDLLHCFFTVTSYFVLVTFPSLTEIVAKAEPEQRILQDSIEKLETSFNERWKPRQDLPYCQNVRPSIRQVQYPAQKFGHRFSLNQSSGALKKRT
jgi:hypothetical protein